MFREVYIYNIYDLKKIIKKYWNYEGGINPLVEKASTRELSFETYDLKYAYLIITSDHER